MKNILDTGKDIVNEIKKTGDSKLLFELFNVRTKIWRYHFIHDEFRTFGTFDDITNLESSQAFKLISTAAEIVINQNDKDLFTSALSLLLTCIETSETTEMPNELLKQWICINNKVGKFNFKYTNEIWNEINKWYRM